MSTTFQHKLACIAATLCMLYAGYMVWSAPSDKQSDDKIEVSETYENSFWNVISAIEAAKE